MAGPPSPSPRPPSRGPASVLAVASAVEPALRRLRRHRERWLDPGSGAGVTIWGNGDNERARLELAEGAAERGVAGPADAPDTGRDEMCSCGNLPGRGFGYSARFRRLSVIGTCSSFRSGSRPPPGLRRVPVLRAFRVGARAGPRAGVGAGAVRAPDCARETTDAPRPSVPAGVFFAAPGHRFLQKRRKAAPEAASLYFHSTPYRQMSSTGGNEK